MWGWRVFTFNLKQKRTVGGKSLKSEDRALWNVSLKKGLANIVTCKHLYLDENGVQIQDWGFS